MAERLHLSIDVEADGPVPGLYSMVSIGIRVVGTPPDRYSDPGTFFYAELAPISTRWKPEALAVSGFSREQTRHFPLAPDAMASLAEWVAINCKERPVWWSDNPGFDWAFLRYYVEAFVPGQDPLFGWSCRRIGDLWAGMLENRHNTSTWRRYRKTKHSHNALDDATGNAEALQALFTQLDQAKKERKC